VRSSSLLIAGLLLMLAAAPPARAIEPREWSFEVFLEEKPIGRQVFRLSEEAGEKRVSIRAELDVKILFFTAYSYRHTNEELWRDGCLRRIDSTIESRRS
jgi:hypothetical protein